MKYNFLKFKAAMLLVLPLLILTSSCENFEEMNIDPNNVSTVPSSYVFTNTMRGLRGQVAQTTGMLYAQHWAETQYTETSRYETPELSFYGFYANLADLDVVIKLNTDEATKGTISASGSNANQIAVARILKAWAYQKMTDVWGDIPYTEALKGNENFQPVYDTQESIYKSLVTELQESASQIQVSEKGVVGDIIYNGDMAMWKKFANSLLLRVGMRMSEVDAAAAKAAVTSALAGGVLTSNDENATYKHLSDANNWNPYYDHFLTRTDYAISNTLTDKMLAKNDPRLPVFADPAPAPLDKAATYVGMPYGVNNTIAGSITNDEISFPGIAVRSAKSLYYYMTYSEVLFNQAEAAARGWTSGDAEALFKSAISASMEQWGVDGTAYLAAATYDATNWKKSIGEEKWVSLYTQGQEAWNEWKRLDYPVLQRAPNATLDREIPRRRGYTSSEFQLNKVNYEAALARQGPDEMETKTWWDK
ncbi:SusD/RagB family nutrient-binding outer membrane lipoprotein [Lacihabitans sp. LS3-19]|uniref:SusD/RagB family nutrient-binding outer membrane lipoprotein n=1 Tax=Lacihabitans sp. LS3-19 TaxID=2487335 RepID=UPI0020CEF998|nr:SusD/RagB family nutrient-binding outer membrane lipoprotein [Lacihabitans sp. LS3-19]MCP9766905.1 SusD/RagB family nutrient-binding outer membrane lipoprotein [Lacihabitans sp. LS3-19]